MTGTDWLAVAIMATALVVVFILDQWDRSARWRRDLTKPLSPRARKWASEQERQP